VAERGVTFSVGRKLKTEVVASSNAITVLVDGSVVRWFHTLFRLAWRYLGGLNGISMAHGMELYSSLSILPGVDYHDIFWANRVKWSSSV
jgi:hypothetical protein